MGLVLLLSYHIRLILNLLGCEVNTALPFSFPPAFSKYSHSYLTQRFSSFNMHPNHWESWEKTENSRFRVSDSAGPGGAMNMRFQQVPR